MAEELYMSVKTDIKSATKDTEDYSKSLEGAQEQLKKVNTTLKAQQEILKQLETAQAQVQKWEKLITPESAATFKSLNKEVAEQTTKVRELTKERNIAKQAVKDFGKVQKENSDTLLNDIKNYKVMGISINGIGKAFKKIIPVARAAFASIKAGMISTGIGALIIAFGSLVAWFTKTKAGAEALSKIFTVVGTAVKVFIDRLISYGKLLASIVTLDFKGMASNAKAAFSGIGDELSREIKLAMELSKATYALADAERAVSVETANRRAEIEDLKLKSQDLNLTEEERLEALEKAGAIESKLMADRVANAEEAVRIQQQQMTMSDNMADDLDKLAQKEIALADIRRESARAQTTITMKANRIRKQVAAQEEREEAAAKARHNRWKKREKQKVALARKFQNKVINEVNALTREGALNALKDEELKQKKIINSQRTAALAQIELIKDSSKTAEELETHKGVLAMKVIQEYGQKILDVGRAFKAKEEKLVKDLQDEITLITTRGGEDRLQASRDVGDEELRIAEENALKADASRLASVEDIEISQELIRDKYKLLREEKKDQEAEEDIERDKRVAAAKAQILADVLAVGQKFMDVQAAELESNYNKEIKLAKANGKSTEAIEEKYAGKRREQAKKFKAMKIAMAIVDTYQSAVAAYASAADIPLAGPVLAPISAALAIAAGLANVAMIQKQPLGGGGGGGGGTAPATAATPPSGNMMSGQFELGGGVAPEPVKAYVVTDEMSNSQNQLANIRRRSTI